MWANRPRGITRPRCRGIGKKLHAFTINVAIKKGAKNDYVLHWQKFLNLSGFFCGEEDGKFGPNTELAVKQYQMAHGLKADGIIGPKTWTIVGK